MKAHTIENESRDSEQLLNKLMRLLEEQINVIHNGDVSGRRVENLSEQAQTLIKDIAEKKLLHLEQFRSHREQIERLYNSLNLAVIAHRDETSKQLKQVRKGKKTLETYSSNI